MIRQRVEGVVAALEAQLKAISDAGNWRLRDAVVYALRYFSHVLREDQFAPLTKMTRRLLCDPVSKVRERAVETLAEVAVCYGAEWAACTVVDMLHAEFDPASQATYMRRVMAIECLAVLLPTVAGLGQQDLRRQHLLGTTTELLQQYAADSVPNVRIALAKAMPRWKNWFASTSREIAVYNEVVHRLKEDGDVDVAEAAKTITLIDSRDREPPHDGTHSSSLSTPF